MARLVADLPKLRAAVTTDDPPTVQPLAVETLAQIDADLLVVHSAQGRVLAEAGTTLERALAAEAGVPSLAEESTFIAHPRGVLQIVSVPIILGPEPVGILGRLTVGFLMDDELAAQFRALTGSEIAFAADGRILASSLPPEARAAMVPALDAPGTTSVMVAGEDYLAMARPMDLGRGRAGDADAALAQREPALLQRPARRPRRGAAA